MNIEVLEFYPIERDEIRGSFSGTLRVKLPELGIHILGIYVTKKKDHWYFSLPSKWANSIETGEPVRYPCFAFDNPDQNRDLMSEIKEKGRSFIEGKFADTDKPIVFAEKKPWIPKQIKPQTKDETSAEVKASDHTVSPKLVPVNFSIQGDNERKILAKQWSDPPPRKERIKTVKRKLKSNGDF